MRVSCDSCRPTSYYCTAAVLCTAGSRLGYDLRHLRVRASCMKFACRVSTNRMNVGDPTYTILVTCQRGTHASDCTNCINRPHPVYRRYVTWHVSKLCLRLIVLARTWCDGECMIAAVWSRAGVLSGKEHQPSQVRAGRMRHDSNQPRLCCPLSMLACRRYALYFTYFILWESYH